MSTLRRRRYVLAGLLVAVAVFAVFLLVDVLSTVFLAITVAYVLLPVRRRLVARGLSARVASALATVLAFLAVLAVLAPLGYLLYERRGMMFEVLRSLPPEVSVEFGEFVYLVELDTVVATATRFITALAVSLARAAPVLALKLTLFTFVVYALLLEPLAVQRALFSVVPPEYHDIVRALHERVRGTLFAIYVLQAATAAGTFVVALAVFFALGYQSAVALAIVAAILQFIPIVGPSLLVLGLAAVDFTVGEPTRAALVAVLGLVLVGFLPDAVIRPRLAQHTTRLPASIYFIGFVGGVLSVGAVGVIAGPLVVALLVELVNLLADEV